MSRSVQESSKTKFDQLPDCAFVRLETLVSEGLIPFSSATLWRKCKNRTFPPPIKISIGVTAWRLGDLRKWHRDPTGYKSINAGSRA
jgi:hypothetical protein